MRVFIGSSSAYVTKRKNGTFVLRRNSPIKKIIEKLKEDYEVEPWWESEVLKTGKHFLDSLIAKAKTCDYGLFIFGCDDPLTDEDSIGVRDNVILECGMFYSVNGKNRTAIIIDDVIRRNKDKQKIGRPCNVKIPSDIEGYKLSTLSTPNIENIILNFFNSYKSEEKYKKRTFYYNSEIINAFVDKKYTEWGTKGLYVGTESARLWSKIEKLDFENHKENHKKVLLDFTDKIIKNQIDTILKIDNIISLGPGAGYFDNEVVKIISRKKNKISYIPIDINPYLAFEAMERLSKITKLRTPFTIVDDFENGYEYIKNIIAEKFHQLNQRNLFMVLGGTFCNLSANEDEILDKFEIWMRKGDLLLLDVFLVNENYKFEDDVSRQPESLEDIYKDLLINSIAKKHLEKVKKKYKNGDVFELLKENFAHHINVDTGNTDCSKIDITKISKLEKTNIASYYFSEDVTDSNKERQELLVAKRYDFEELKEYLEQDSRFSIIESTNGFIDDDIGTEIENETNKSRGLFLIEKL